MKDNEKWHVPILESKLRAFGAILLFKIFYKFTEIHSLTMIKMCAIAISFFRHMTVIQVK